MELGREQKRVCVTGASGFIASWLVKLLLQRGYIVHATVRSIDDPAKTEHLLALDGAKERLHLFEANLTEEGSFDSAIQGCDGVFHTASPVLMDSPNPQVDIVDPAVKGTLNVLTSCAKTPTVKRVVFTSSNAAVLYSGRPYTDETVVDETWFSTPEACMASPAPWYCLSKTLAEEAAWKFSKERGIDMVVITPGLVIGPFLEPKLNLGASFVLTWIKGSTTKLKLNLTLWWVHVKDVAEAHIQAFEIPSANGRYNMAERIAHPSEAIKILNELYPNTFTLPDMCTGDQSFNPSYKVSKDKIRSLGINYIPLEVGLRETVECLREKKFVSF